MSSASAGATLVPPREAIDPEFTWDLSAIFSDWEAWDAGYRELDQRIDAYQKRYQAEELPRLDRVAQGYMNTLINILRVAWPKDKPDLDTLLREAWERGTVLTGVTTKTASPTKTSFGRNASSIATAAKKMSSPCNSRRRLHSTISDQIERDLPGTDDS